MKIKLLQELNPAGKNNYNIVGIYNDAGYYGKNLMWPEMQRLLVVPNLFCTYKINPKTSLW